jgi:hypothetical protein
MLDDVERRRFLVEPAREHASPDLVGLLDIELDESAGKRRALPRRGRLARTQADNHVADAQRLAGLHRQVADDAVALVEQADHRDPLGHRGLADMLQHRALAGIDHRAALVGRGRAVAAREQHRGSGDRQAGAAHGYCGVHAW